MSVFTVPSLDEEPWPTLGPAICDLIEERCCFGPGDLRGQPAVIDDEKRALIYRAYEVYPRDHPRAGWRRYKRVVISLRKGSAKTELGMWMMYAELHPEGPVRTDGWTKVDGIWQPVGRPVVDPYIPMVAYTEDQTAELAYGALLVMCTEGPDSDLFDGTKDAITRAYGDGKAVALASSPNAADGARTTAQHFDETHRMILPRHKETHQTMQMNIPKRVLSDAWSLETTTTYAEGEGSVAEGAHEYAEAVARGDFEDSTLMFFHREAPARDGENLDDPKQLREAIRIASGPALSQWPNFEGQVEAIAAIRNQPDTDKPYWERVYLNRRVSSSRQAFDKTLWRSLERSDFVVPLGDPITIGFDGARWRDACGFVATHIPTGFQWPLAVWEKPVADQKKKHEPGLDRIWEVKDEDVDGALDEAIANYHVVRVYADPPRFEANVSRWAGTYGEHRIFEWYTARPKMIGQAFRAYTTAMRTGALSQNGDRRFEAHITAARKDDTNQLDDDGQKLWTICKPKPNSPRFIDLSMAGCLSWKARLDAIAKGGWEREAAHPMTVS